MIEKFLDHLIENREEFELTDKEFKLLKAYRCFQLQEKIEELKSQRYGMPLFIVNNPYTSQLTQTCCSYK